MNRPPTLRRILELEVVGSLAALVVFLLALSSGYRITVSIQSTGVIAAAAIGALIALKPARYWAISPSLLCIVGISWPIMAWSTSVAFSSRMHHPQLITLPSSVCKQIADADEKAGVPLEDRTPCRFSAYVFPATRYAGWYTFGASANVAEKCYFLAPSLIDIRFTIPDFDAPAIHELPARCLKEIPIAGDVPPLPW